MKLRRALRQARFGAELAVHALHERLESGIVFNPIRHRADPYPHYRELRERDPIHRARTAFGWVLTRYEDVLAVLRDPRFSADDRNFVLFPMLRAQDVEDGLADPEQDGNPVMLRSDPPVHTRLRGLVNKAFTQRAVEKLRPRVESIANELLAPFAGAERMDLVGDFAVPFPVTIIAEMLGIPSEDRDRFKRWSDILVGFIDPGAPSPPHARRAMLDEFGEYIGAIVEERRRKPTDDLLSALVLAEEAGDHLSEEELFGTVALLLAAGNETTTNLIGNGVRALLGQRDPWKRLLAEPDLVPCAVEELLRFDSPVQVTGRIPLEDLDFRGHRFERGQMIVLALAAANRDPAVFDEPDRLDVGRADNRHVAFSFGIHFCLGAQLARLEAEVALRALLQRFPALARAEAADVWRPGLVLRGLERLPVMLR